MTNKRGKILIIDDDEDILQAARLLLKQHVAQVHTEKKPDTIPSLLKNESYDVIFLDMNFAKGATSGQEGFDWLNKILEIDPSSVVVLITAFGDVEMAVRAYDPCLSCATHNLDGTIAVKVDILNHKGKLLDSYKN